MMGKCYHLLFASLMLLGMFASALAIEIDQAEVLVGTPVPLGDVGSLSCGTTIYQNTAGGYIYTSSTPRWNMLDDGAFPSGTAPVCLGCIEFGFYQGVQEQLYVEFDFWDTLVPGGPVCNLTWLGGYVINFGVVPAGAYTSGTLELPTPITFADDAWCVEMAYFKSLTPLSPATGATVLFANGGPSIGTNDATIYWRDANGNGTFECPGEARSFSAPNKSQFYLKLDATLIPSAVEPTNWGTIKALYR
jgi:hypothetical protein